MTTERIPTVLLNERSSVQFFYRKMLRYITMRERELGGPGWSVHGWVDIPSETIQSMARSAGVKEPYTEPLNRFVDQYGLLLRNKHYRPGKCREYAISPWFDEHYLEATTEMEPFKEPRRIRLEVDDSYSCSDDWFRTHIKPVYCSSLKAYRFFPSALQAIEKWKTNERTKDVQRAYCYGEERWLKYEHKQRAYSTWTNTQRELRKHAHINGEPLVCFDFKNLHPGIVGALANDEALMAASEQGSVYELLMEATGLVSRDRVKQQTNAVINAKPSTRTYKDSETGSWQPLIVKSAFAGLFPQAMSKLNELKRDDHTNAHRAMMKQEWSIMFPLCQRLYREVAKPNKTKVLPLHDAVYVPASIADECEEVLNTHKPRRLILDRQDLSQQNQPNKKQEFILF